MLFIACNYTYIKYRMIYQNLYELWFSEISLTNKVHLRTLPRRKVNSYRFPGGCRCVHGGDRRFLFWKYPVEHHFTVALFRLLLRFHYPVEDTGSLGNTGRYHWYPCHSACMAHDYRAYFSFVPSGSDSWIVKIWRYLTGISSSASRRSSTDKKIVFPPLQKDIILQQSWKPQNKSN